MKLNRLVQLALIALLSTVLAGCSEPPYHNIGNATLKVFVDKGVPLYDIRRPEEWKQTGVVEGSIKRTFFDASGRPVPGFLEDFTRKHPKNEPVALICRTGNRTSTLATYLVEELGYSQVFNVRDGITDWIARDYPVVR